MGFRISDLPAAAGANSAMQFEVNNGGVSERLTLAQMFALSTGAVVADTPLLNFAQTWNNAAVTFTGWKLNVTDAASAAASLLVDLQTGGTSKFSVSKNGDITGGGTTNQVSGDWYVGSASCRLHTWGLTVRSEAALAWTNGTSTSSPLDTMLYRDAAGMVAQRNGTNAQAFRIYHTFTDASNYERGFLRANAGGAFEIGTERAGTGSNRSLLLTPATGLVQLGGTTSSFPALKANVAVLEAKLADDSAYADLACATVDFKAAATSAPTSTPAGFTPTNYLGDDFNTMLSPPATWLIVKVAGTNYRIPLYPDA